MKISFADIYEKAIGLFDDPRLTEAYKESTIRFQKLMYTYLQNSISLFNNPLEIAIQLSNYTPPKGITETFEASEAESVFVIDDNFELTPNSSYEFIVDNKIIEGIVDEVDRSVTFSESGKSYSFEQYFPGEFDVNLGSLGDVGTQRMALVSIRDIMARLLVRAWSEEKRNFLLDIQNILNDTDFRLHPASSALRSKNLWVEQLENETAELSNKLAWLIKFSKARGG